MPSKAMMNSILAVEPRAAAAALATPTVSAQSASDLAEPTPAPSAGGWRLYPRERHITLRAEGFGGLRLSDPYAQGAATPFGALPTWQSSWRAVQAHDAVRIRGVAQTLVAGTPTVGRPLPQSKSTASVRDTSSRPVKPAAPA